MNKSKHQQKEDFAKRLVQFTVDVLTFARKFNNDYVLQPVLRQY